MNNFYSEQLDYDSSTTTTTAPLFYYISILRQCFQHMQYEVLLLNPCAIFTFFASQKKRICAVNFKKKLYSSSP